jgi:hypothetical protein
MLFFQIIVLCRNNNSKIMRTIRFFMTVTSLLAVWNVSAKNNAIVGEPPVVPEGPKVDFPIPHRSPKPIRPVSATYDATSTMLTVNFPITSGGKVEIYRNGVCVVRANASAGVTKNYILRNYGKGNYTIIVSNGNTVVYSNMVVIKN